MSKNGDFSQKIMTRVNFRGHVIWFVCIEKRVKTCEICEIFKNTFSIEDIWTTASVYQISLFYTDTAIFM